MYVDQALGLVNKPPGSISASSAAGEYYINLCIGINIVVILLCTCMEIII